MKRAIDSDRRAQPAAGNWLWTRNPLAWVLWPLSWIFCVLVASRRGLYRLGVLKSHKLNKPVVIVGNISVGGSGKTPVVVVLAKLLQAHGYRPAVLTRGYKSDLESGHLVLEHGDESELAGDEANMLSQLCACPIAIGADRVEAGRALLSRHTEVDIVISDDGLQHYALARDIEIIVKRDHALGNRWCLPAGPLREALSRLKQCDLLIDRDSQDLAESFGRCWSLDEREQTRELTEFRGQPLYALAGIGFPELFFQALRQAGLEVQARGFPDHHEFLASDLPPDDGTPLLITHKDAVKLKRLGRPNTWVAPLELELADDLQYRFLKLIENLHHG